jgi:hypothetical protein
MAAFRFRLDKVLEWYREQCQIEENRLAEQNLDLLRTREAIARLQAERLGIEGEILVRDSIPASDFAALGLYRLRAKNEEAGLQLEREGKDRAVEEQRTRVRYVRRRIRLLEKLRERHLGEYIYAEQRTLENLAGDSYLAKWSRELLAGRSRGGATSKN